MSFKIESVKQNKMTFLDVQIILDDKTFTPSAYHKSTVIVVYKNFDSFLPSTYKFGIACTFAYRCLQIRQQISLSKRNFPKKWLNNPEDFTNKCFKKFMDNLHVVKETTLTVEKKPLVLVVPYLGPISLQPRAKLKKSSKKILNCCKLQIVFKNKTRLGNNFHFKDRIPKDLTSGVVYNFHCGLCNESYYAECITHLNVRIGIIVPIRQGLVIKSFLEFFFF